MKTTKTDWIKYFPFPTVRPLQEKVINEIIDSFKSGKKYVLADLPTGVGKSAIGVALANYFKDNNTNIEQKSAFLLTTQIILQEQYIRDFPYIANISAKQNYLCVNRSNGITCDVGLTIANVMVKMGNFKFNNYKSTCCYEIAKNRFYDEQIGLTNLPFFLSHDRDKLMTKRSLMIVDECHNLENVVTDFAAVTFNRYFIEEILQLRWPYVSNMKIDEFIKWVNDTVLPKVETVMATFEGKINSISGGEKGLTSQSSIGMMKKMDEFTRVKENISTLNTSYSQNEWVLTVSDTQDIVSIKPIYASKFTERLLFNKADRVLMMSGTILDKATFCKTNGIPEKDTHYITLESPFEIKNREVHVCNISSMGRKNIDVGLPIITEAIREILEMHKNDKGIIHTNTYKNANYINNILANDRLLLHTSSDRRDVLNYHIDTKKPTVLVSPSFTEGVDLKGELSRFQIIAKVMYPFLGDKYTQTKMQLIKGWYEWMTVKNMIQASGRSIRDENDYCTTYILDSDFSNLLKYNKHLFPKWWLDSLIMP